MYRIESFEKSNLLQLQIQPTLNINGIDFTLLEGRALSAVVNDSQIRTFSGAEGYRVVREEPPYEFVGDIPAPVDPLEEAIMAAKKAMAAEHAQVEAQKLEDMRKSVEDEQAQKLEDMRETLEAEYAQKLEEAKKIWETDQAQKLKESIASFEDQKDLLKIYSRDELNAMTDLELETLALQDDREFLTEQATREDIINFLLEPYPATKSTVTEATLTPTKAELEAKNIKTLRADCEALKLEFKASANKDELIALLLAPKA